MIVCTVACQIKVWTANPQQFVEDEDDDTFSYSVRISAQDLLLVRYWKHHLYIFRFRPPQKCNYKSPVHNLVQCSDVFCLFRVTPMCTAEFHVSLFVTLVDKK